MAVREIVTYGHPVLREPAQEVLKIDNEILDVVQDLKDTLASVQGLGLAAPQIGVNKQIFIADLSILNDRKHLTHKVVFINPKIISVSKQTDTDNEGCLSFPGVRGDVCRPFKVKMRGLIPSGAERIIDAKGLFARCLQHEYDHLHGKLFIDYFLERDRIENEMLIRSYLETNKKQLPNILE
ncbi:peptide deformylase [Brevinema andersonii]|uniref:Peptide deformylase n=1 Tax=Brevinema andersonii TaxID=34097 RepID=A0A1I1D2J8_BREAD|nr:peptide deformylase [Brevinema andersonii]SFB69007.1 peptide deformylase [Brevinema andersonii]